MVNQKHQSPVFRITLCRITLLRIAIRRFHLGSHKDPSSWVFQGLPILCSLLSACTSDSRPSQPRSDSRNMEGRIIRVCRFSPGSAVGFFLGGWECFPWRGHPVCHIRVIRPVLSGLCRVGRERGRGIVAFVAWLFFVGDGDGNDDVEDFMFTRTHTGMRV